EVTTTIDGSQLGLRAKLADACVALGGDHLARAINEHQEILVRDQGRIASYRALVKLYGQTNQPERARACSEAIAHLVSYGLAERDGEEPTIARTKHVVIARLTFE